MKPLLALVTLALASLMFEEKARQIAGDAKDAYNEIAAQALEAKQALTGQIERQPLMSLVFAGGIAFALAAIIPSRD